MKILLGLAILLSTSAFACPDLQGTFARCISAYGSLNSLRNVTITQEEVEGEFTYSIQSVDEITSESSVQTLKADGKVTSQMDHDGVTETTRTYCDNDILYQEISFSKAGIVLGTGQRTMMRAAEGSVTSSIFGKLGNKIISDTLICR